MLTCSCIFIVSQPFCVTLFKSHVHLLMFQVIAQFLIMDEKLFLIFKIYFLFRFSLWLSMNIFEHTYKHTDKINSKKQKVQGFTASSGYRHDTHQNVSFLRVRKRI